MAMKVVTICGSLRKASLNRALMNELPGLAPAGMTFIEAPSYRDFPLLDADLQAREGIPAGVTVMGEAIDAADGVIIVSPEYNWSIPGALKNGIDWLSRLPKQPFKEKAVLIQSVTGGALGGARMQYQLRMALTFLNAFVFGTPEVFVGMGPTKFDAATMALTDEATRKMVAVQLSAFEAFAARLNR